MRPQARFEHAGPVAHRLFPKRRGKARPVEVFVTATDVIDEQIKAAVLLFHSGEERFDLSVASMIAGDGNASAPSRGDRCRCLSDGAWKTFRRPARVAAAGNIDSRARFSERQRDSLADATTGTGDNRHCLTRN